MNAAAASVADPAVAPAATGPVKEERQRTWWGRHGRTSTIWSLRLVVFVAFLVIWQLAHGLVSNPMFISNHKNRAWKCGSVSMACFHGSRPFRPPPMR